MFSRSSLFIKHVYIQAVIIKVEFANNKHPQLLCLAHSTVFFLIENRPIHSLPILSS